MGNSKDRKQQNAISINKEREMDTQRVKFSAIFNSELTKPVLYKYTVEQIAKALRRGPFGDITKETVLNIRTIIYVWSPNEPERFRIMVFEILIASFLFSNEHCIEGNKWFAAGFIETNWQKEK